MKVNNPLVDITLYKKINILILYSNCMTDKRDNGRSTYCYTDNC